MCVFVFVCVCVSIRCWMPVFEFAWLNFAQIGFPVGLPAVKS